MPTDTGMESMRAFTQKELPGAPVEKGVREQRVLGDLSKDQFLAAAFDGYFNDLTSGDTARITLARLKLKPQFYESGGIKYLFDPETTQYVFDQQGQYITEANLPKLDKEQADILISVGGILEDPKLPSEVRLLIQRYLKSGDGRDFLRLTSLMSLGNSNIAERVEDVIGRFEVLKRRLELEASFYAALGNDGSIGKPLEILASFDTQDVKDTQLVGRLRSRALDIRRAAAVKDFATALAVPNTNFDQTLSLLDILEKSPIEADRASARVLRKTLYKLEIDTFRAKAYEMVTKRANVQDIFRFLDGFPARPSVGDFDYDRVQSELKERVANLYMGLGKIDRLKQANQIRAEFERGNPAQVVQRINGLPEETEEEIAIKLELLDLYKNFVAANRPEVFDERFRQEIIARNEAKLRQKFMNPELGQNKEAFRYLRENFIRAIFPLVESLRDDPRTKKEVESLLTVQVDGSQVLNPRLRFIQKLNELESQRPLTDIERTYIQSVELLTLFNPYLVAAATSEFGVTSEFLRHHFEVLAKETIDNLEDGAYFPLIQVGTGPNGLAAFGEIVRNNPELARQALVVDSGIQPGGPFAIPRGPAWELNSANRRGIGGYSMPDAPGERELKTVRAYGSPVARWYPGERSGGRAVRQGSINTTVDYLPTPDDLSNARYPTNEELQTILALQTAILVQNLALRTSLVKVEPNPNQGEQGDKIATLKIRNEDGSERIVKLKTDAVFVSSGLGEPTYGFRLEGSRAERVLAETQGLKGFPKITTTLEAFKEFSDRTSEKRSPGRTLAIWGKGNSADTLIEFIGNIFQSDNPLVRDVSKIYIISEGNLSARPRYALISDLKPRNGRGNLIEQITARVADVDFADRNRPPERREIVLIDPRGNIIVDGEGRQIRADSGIAATGFRPQLENIFSSYSNNRPLVEQGENSPLVPIALPTNPNVAVAESFRGDPNIILLGTASDDGFMSADKRSQLPSEARDALARNGVENAVAIGFRAPDTQAAVNIWLNRRSVNLVPKLLNPKEP